MISTEDLWDLSLESLDGIAKHYHNKLEDATVSFIKKTSPANTISNDKLEIVKAVIKYKMDAAESAANRADAIAKAKARKEQILLALEEKEGNSLKKKSAAALRAELAELEDNIS